MIDIHAHLNFPELLVKVDKIVEDSKKAGLMGIIVGSSNLEDSKIAIGLAKKYSGFLYASVGIHPQKTDPENKTTIKEQLAVLDKLLESTIVLSTIVDRNVINKGLCERNKIVVAIGETGLDYSEPPPGEEERSKKEQEELFIGQLNLAAKHNLPVVVHAREAVDETIEKIQELGNLGIKELRGVFHCYSGGKKRIKKILDLPGEWYFGIDGNLTYDQGLQNVVKEIPKDRLLVETDSPFLAPDPYRGQICTPVYLPLIVQKVAEIWGEGLETTKKQLLKNTKELFSILK